MIFRHSSFVESSGGSAGTTADDHDRISVWSISAATPNLARKIDLVYLGAMTLGQRLRTARERLKKRQQDVATELEVSQVTVSMWESGRSVPNLRDIKRIAWAYGLPVHELVDSDIPEVA
jgi:DNA-binding XRE family transcriptional regulator